MAILSAIFLLLGLCGNDTMLFYGPTIFSDVDIGLPYSLVITLPWVGVSLGYALSSPLMARWVAGGHHSVQDESGGSVRHLLLHHGRGWRRSTARQTDK